MRSHMSGNTPWNFQNSARRGLPPGQNFVVPGQSWQRGHQQSPRGQKLLVRNKPGPTEYVPPKVVSPSVVTGDVIPYYDPKSASLFITQFGGVSPNQIKRNDGGSRKKHEIPVWFRAFLQTSPVILTTLMSAGLFIRMTRVLDGRDVISTEALLTYYGLALLTVLSAFASSIIFSELHDDLANRGFQRREIS